MSVETSPSEEVNLSRGESATVSFELTAEKALTDVNISATSPLGVSVDATERQVDSLADGETFVYEIVVTADRPVSRTLDVVVEATVDGTTLTQRVPYDIDATGESGNGSAAGTGDSGAVPAVSEATGATTSTNDTTSTAAATSSSITVSGRAAYTDTNGNVFGLSNVRVRLFDTDGGSKVLGSTSTAADGSFRFSVDPSSDVDGDGEIVARVIVVAENDAVYVTDGGGIYRFYATSGTLTGGDSVTLGSDVNGDGSKELVSSGNNAPFQAVDWAYTAAKFARDNGVHKSKLPIYYPVGDWAYYKYWTDGREQIQLPDRSYYDWDAETVAHEYGHSVHTQLRGYTILEKNSYSCHAIPSETDPAYALVEGFAEYYSAAALNDPNAVYWYGENIETNQFYDMAYSGECANGDASGEYDGLSVEGSVASILWDITDGGANDDDPISYRFSVIADILEHNPANINEFYRIWDNGHRAALDSIYTRYGIDKEPPAIESTFKPTPYTDSSVVLNGSVLDDEVGTDRLQMSIDGGSFTTVTSSDGSWETTRDLADGSHTVTLRATDANGNTREVDRTIRVSSTPPTATTEDGKISDFGSPDGTVSVGFTYAMRYPKNATVRVLDDGSLVTTTSISGLSEAPDGNTESVSVRLPKTVGDGSYDVEVVVRDTAGRTDTARIDDVLRVDTTPPSFENVTLVDAYVNASTPLTFRVDSADTGAVESGVESVTVLTAGSGSQLSTSGGTWTGTAAPNGTDGNHTAVIRVVDEAGNVNETEIAYEVDTTGPNVTVTAPRYTNRTEITVSGTVEDANLSTLRIRTPNATRELRATTGNYTTVATVENGSNTLVLTATDAAENTVHREVNVGVDHVAPTGNLSRPGRVGASAGPSVSNHSDPVLVFNVTDNLAGINESAIGATVDGESAAVTASRENGTVTVQGENLTDGSHEATVVLVDRAGNERQSNATFRVDTVPPTIQNVTLPDGSNRTIKPGDSLPVSVNASDALTAVGRVSARETALANRSGTWRGNATAPIQIGTRSIEIRVVDAGGNVKRTNVSVYVGTRQTANVSSAGVATVEPVASEVESLSVRVIGSGANNSTFNTSVELTSGVTMANPVANPVPDEHVSYYTQFEFNLTGNETDGGAFVLRVSKNELGESAGLPDTVKFWVYNRSSGGWAQLNSTKTSETESTLTYRIETPHFSTFAVSSAVDDDAPSLSIEGPSSDGKIKTGTHALRATFSDNESRVIANRTSVTVNGEPVNMSKAAVLNGTVLRMPFSLEAGNYTFEVTVVDEFGNSETASRNVTVYKPRPSGGGGGGGGGGGQGGDSGGDSAEAIATNSGVTVNVRDLATGGSLSVDFPDGAAASDVGAVTGLDLKALFGDDRFRVEVSTPTGTPPRGVAPLDRAMGYFTIEVFQTDGSAIDSGKVRFTVSSLPTGTEPDDVVLYRYHDGRWQTLETHHVRGDTYVATSPGFSAFAIGTTQEGTPTSTPTATKTATSTPRSRTVAGKATSSTPTGTAPTNTDSPGFGIWMAVVAILLLPPVARFRGRR